MRISVFFDDSGCITSRNMFIPYNTLVHRRTTRVPCVFSAKQYAGKTLVSKFLSFFASRLGKHQPRYYSTGNSFRVHSISRALACAGRHPLFVMALRSWNKTRLKIWTDISWKLYLWEIGSPEQYESLAGEGGFCESFSYENYGLMEARK